MHQVAKVLARFWIHPPLFQNLFAKVGASSNANPQYHVWVGRFRYVYSKFQRSYAIIKHQVISGQSISFLSLEE